MADVLTLKDGQQLTGTLVSRNADGIVFEAAGNSFPLKATILQVLVLMMLSLHKRQRQKIKHKLRLLIRQKYLRLQLVLDLLLKPTPPLIAGNTRQGTNLPQG